VDREVGYVALVRLDNVLALVALARIRMPSAEGLVLRRRKDNVLRGVEDGRGDALGVAWCPKNERKVRDSTGTKEERERERERKRKK